MLKKAYIKNFGCQMNVRDAEVVAGLLIKEGYRIVEDSAKADIVILNTCSVRQHAEDKVWSEIGRYRQRQFPRRENKEHLSKTVSGKIIIGVIGCMAQNYKENIFQRAPTVDFVVGPSDIHRIPEILKKVLKCQSVKVSGRNLFELKALETDSLSRPEEIYHSGFYQDKEHAYVVISEGCSNFCSYCVVPYVRGELHNRKYQDILKEIKEALERKIKRVTLLGQNVNAYQDGGINFIRLLEEVNSFKGLAEFSFITSHPKDTTPDLFRAMADAVKLKKHLHLPVQSGSDRILKLMNRGYTRNFYLDLAKGYRKIATGGVLTTDIIIGFPGERQEDFKDTYNLVKEIEFDAAYIFKYSPRPHTQALNFNDDVPQEDKERRHGLILELQKEISRKKVKKK